MREKVSTTVIFLLIFLLESAFIVSPGCKTNTTPNRQDTSELLNPVPIYTYKIIGEYPHAPNAFTQGLGFDNGFLYEGTGLQGQSTLRKVDLETGYVLKFQWLPPEYFGEGITVYHDQIIQLTWKSHKGFVYNKNSFELLNEFNYPTEGWGITHDGKRLIMSDGTATLHFLDPENFKEIETIEVSDSNTPLTGLNELEYVKGEIFANIWLTDRIARISPSSGKVIGWIDLKGLLDPHDCQYPVDVLNGIAYDPEGDRLFVTGKLWPKIFEIKIIKK